MLIKRRQSKTSKRGVYLQDRQLTETSFQPGTKYTYVVDREARQLIILPADDGSNTVSKRKLTNAIKPVIDIRSEEVKTTFADAEYLQVEIHDEQIIVHGYAKEIASEQRSEAIENDQQGIVRDIQDFLAVRHVGSVVMSVRDLGKAVGGYEQLRLFSDDIFDSVPRQAREPVRYAHIPLLVDSLFSGAGFLDLGFLQAGFKVAFAVEKNKDAYTTYRENIGEHIVCDDIWNVVEDGFHSPVMVGGSPCQGFSNSNRHSHFLDNPNNQLVRAYIEAVKNNPNCQVFVLENVPQLLTTGSGAFRDEIMEELSDFEITYGILNSADHGCPQLRKRAFMIGSKIGRIQLPKPLTSEYRTVSEAFAGLTDAIPNQRDLSTPKQLTIERMRHVPPGGNVHSIPEALRPKGQHSDMYYRLMGDEPSVTIVNPRKAMLLHPEEDRILSVRECARLQGVDDDFVFYGKLDSKQQQVANGVPVQLAKAVADVVKWAIHQFNIRKWNTNHSIRPQVAGA